MLEGPLEPDANPKAETPPETASELGEAAVGSSNKEPIIQTPEEAYALAKERPVLAETMARTAQEEVDRRRSYNQDAIDQHEERKEKFRYSASDETMRTHDHEIARLKQEMERFEEEARRIEFWAAVTTLHPISESYQKRNLSNYVGWKQPILMEHIEREVARLEEDVRIHSPEALVAYRASGGLGSGRADWEETMSERVGNDLVEIARLGQVVQDVINGKASEEITDPSA